MAGSSPAKLLRQLGLRPRKRFSQSFLVDPHLPEQIVAAADVGPRDEVLEIGPGLGVLTRPLARSARRVVAVELDRDLATALPQLVPENVEVVEGNALELDPSDWFVGAYKLVANLPYHVSSPVLLRYLSLANSPGLLLVMVQREVAERIVEQPGRLSFLAVAVQSAATARVVRIVSPGAFYPRPKVESAVVRLELLPTPLVPLDCRSELLRLVDAGFAQPRKQLANSLTQGLGWSKADVLELLLDAGIRPDRRPQELSLAQWKKLFEKHQGHGDAD